MLRIAVDIDEVLAQHNRELALWHNKTYGTQHTAETYFTDKWWHVWDTTYEAAEKRALVFYEDRPHSRLAPVPGANQALQKLKQAYSLSIVTVRRQRVIEDTQSWLATYFPDLFDDVHFVHFWDSYDKRTKAELCKDIGADYLIDDSVKHCNLAQQAGIQAILFGDYSWNRSGNIEPGVKRAHDWSKVTRILLPKQQ